MHFSAVLQPTCTPYRFVFIHKIKNPVIQTQGFLHLGFIFTSILKYESNRPFKPGHRNTDFF